MIRPLQGRSFIILRNYNRNKNRQNQKNTHYNFQKYGFYPTHRTNLKEVEFLEVTFTLRKGIYQPYRKPKDKYTSALNNQVYPTINLR